MFQFQLLTLNVATVECVSSNEQVGTGLHHKRSLAGEFIIPGGTYLSHDACDVPTPEHNDREIPMKT